MTDRAKDIDLKWEQVRPREWAAFYNVGTYRIKETKGGVFPKYVLTFETDMLDLGHAKRMAARFAATRFGDAT